MKALDFKAKLRKMTASFDASKFPYDFFVACGWNQVTIDRLRKGGGNKTDMDGAVLERGQIHIKGCAVGRVQETMEELRTSKATLKKTNKVKYLLACDGEMVCIDLLDGGRTSSTLEFLYPEFSNQAHVEVLFPLAGIGKVKPIIGNEVDAHAAEKLNDLYMELMEANRSWNTSNKRNDIHLFLARIVFCFFAEDTGVFKEKNIFTRQVKHMTKNDAASTHKVIAEIFESMNRNPHDGEFRYVNGGLFAGNLDVPVFGRVARDILVEIGGLEWTKINPDIFGSMIQTIASSEERSRLGMHYTSVENIMRVLRPLFLEDLDAALLAAGNDKSKLAALRERISRIRVFDPACGSGNFLVIAYKEMRRIESETNKALGKLKHKSMMHLSNFRGIEYKEFPVMIARLALVIAQFQCDKMYRGHAPAVSDLLPLKNDNWTDGSNSSDRRDGNWITRGNSLRLNWVELCPPAGVDVIVDDSGELKLSESKETAVKFQSTGGEVYICGNPPFVSSRGSDGRSAEQNEDMKRVFDRYSVNCGKVDYVAAWFIRSAEYIRSISGSVRVASAFVSTNSICQGEHVPSFWPSVFGLGCEISFAYTSFKWKNHASDNAAVSVVIVGLSNEAVNRRIFSLDSSGETFIDVENISPYLVSGKSVVVDESRTPLCEQAIMRVGHEPRDCRGGLTISEKDLELMSLSSKQKQSFTRRYVAGDDYLKGTMRYCLWIESHQVSKAMNVKSIRERLNNIRNARMGSRSSITRRLAKTPHEFNCCPGIAKESTIIVPRVSTPRRKYIPVGLFETEVVVAHEAFALLDAPLWNFSLLSSKLHMVWLSTVSGRLGDGLRYSTTFCWNTFPIPPLTCKMRDDMKKCAERILIERKRHIGKTIADLYDPDKMPDNLREAHACNDEVIAGIYIGRKEFRDETEMHEELFSRYAAMKKDTNLAAKQKHATKSNKNLKTGLFAEKKKRPDA